VRRRPVVDSREEGCPDEAGRISSVRELRLAHKAVCHFAMHHSRCWHIDSRAPVLQLKHQPSPECRQTRGGSSPCQFDCRNPHLKTINPDSSRQKKIVRPSPCACMPLGGSSEHCAHLRLFRITTLFVPGVAPPSLSPRLNSRSSRIPAHIATASPPSLDKRASAAVPSVSRRFTSALPQFGRSSRVSSIEVDHSKL
jgi:hypothetical protein